MATVQVRDDAIWLKHIEGDADLRERIRSLDPGDVLDLEVDGVIGQWERMRDGKDGRPTFGIKPISTMREVWARLRGDTGRIVQVREVAKADSYLLALRPLLGEWDTPEDEMAYRDL